MSKQIKIFFSSFLLFLFLVPLVEREVHASEHLRDNHCTTGDKHYHDLEHHCSLCDFTLTDSNKPTDIEYQLIVAFKPFSFQFLPESLLIPGDFKNLPSRASPVA